MTKAEMGRPSEVYFSVWPARRQAGGLLFAGSTSPLTPPDIQLK